MPICCNAATSSKLILLFLIFVLLWSANAQHLADLRANIQTLKFVHAVSYEDWPVSDDFFENIGLIQKRYSLGTFPKGKTINSQIHCEQLDQINAALTEKRAHKGQIFFLHDNARQQILFLFFCGRPHFRPHVFKNLVWRHGDRSPSVLIPTDVDNNISSWKQGLGELTKLGLSQQYRLGLFLRQRYDGWLSKEYSPFEIYLRSSDYNRTLMSAQANMAGLFTPTRSEVFVKDLHWRPIPVHTMPKGTDKILFDSVFCPAATAEEHNIYSGDEVAAIEKENEAVLRFVGHKAGFKRRLALRDLWMVFDPLNSEFCHSDEHSMPKWVNSSIKDEIWRLYDLSSFFLYKSNLLTRLRGGPIFTDILNRMKSVAMEQQDLREKFYAYSAHDTTVAGILAGFGIHPVSFPPYSSMVLVEMHQTENGKYFVKLFYKNVTDSKNIWEHDIADCASPCSLEDLEQARLPIIPLNWEEECGLYEWYHFSARTYMFVIGALAVLCIALFIEILLLNLRSRRELDDSMRRREEGVSQKFLLETEEEEDEDDVYP